MPVDKKYCDILMFYECNTAEHPVKRNIVKWQLAILKQSFPSVPLKFSILFNEDCNKNSEMPVKKNSVLYNNSAFFNWLDFIFQKNNLRRKV